MSAGVSKMTIFRVATLCATLLFSSSVLAQGPAARITGPVVDSDRVALAGSRHPQATAAADAGTMTGGTQINGMTIAFNRSATQQAALATLLAAQQNPASPLYHQWLTPDQFAAQFGVADSDLSAVSNWLSSHGLQVGTISRSRDRISFSGSAAQFAAAFGTPIHYYNVNGQKHFAPSGDVTLPAAIASSIASLENVTDFRAHSYMVKPATPAFTSAQTGNHFLTPKDLSTIYDINPAYTAGFNGTGQSIAVIGQSAVVTSDITNFQAAAGVPVRAPMFVLIPGSGISTPYEGDESESDLDLEYSSGIGQNATIYFVYTGSNPNDGVFQALIYAVENRVAPIITLSYGYCEASLTQGEFTSMDSTLQQAAAQGQTVVNSSGDSGSTACYGEGLTTSEQVALTVSYPASSQYATGVGGTEFPTADVAAAATPTTPTTYWSAATATTDTIGSALSYIPEVVWNDDSTGGLSASGGGVSIFTLRPSWQTGVTGITAGSYRLVPDISLSSSAVNAAYLYCSSDPSVGIDGSCTNGFRDANDVYLTVAGGTSFSTPVFAGMLSLISQHLNANGLGVINPTLYQLAANPATYATAFHDITSGTNGCTAFPASVPCTAADTSSYAAGVGYDEATGLGSIDLYNLLTAWPQVTSLAGSRVTLTPATSSLVVNTNDAITITVAPSSSTSVLAPTGTVALSVDGTTVTTLTLVNGVASYTFQSAASGPHVIYVAYSGNSTYAPSSGSLVLTVGSAGGFTISAPALTMSSGNTGNETITLTPSGGYTGSVGFTVSTTAAITNSCYDLGSATVSSTQAVQTTLTIYTSSSICTGYTPLLRRGGTIAAVSGHGSQPGGVDPRRSAPIGISLAGLVAIGVLGRRSRRLRGLVVIALLAVAGFGMSGCGDSNTSNATPVNGGSSNSPTGSYTVTVTATDAYTPSITATTTFTLTLQ
jgi:hypothetical protein